MVVKNTRSESSLRSGSNLYCEDDKKRELAENSSDVQSNEYRSVFSRDYARLVHSPSFRRLQGKLQLLPAGDNDFFRNRLTHSIEVAQIATGIGRKLNAGERLFQGDKLKIDLDLLAFAGLAHDIGHPPFGHAGERVLDRLMKDYGGFEGNAQTLRILARLEEKRIDTTIQGADGRRGLNLSFRSLASILKYDNCIPTLSKNRTGQNFDRPEKGYYRSENDLVKRIRESVGVTKKLRTIECSVMDVADDIAYSTYDLEDAFKGGLLSPIEIAAIEPELRTEVLTVINKKIDENYADITQDKRRMTEADLDNGIYQLFGDLSDIQLDEILNDGAIAFNEFGMILAARLFRASKTLIRSDKERTEFTSKLVGKFIGDVELIANEENPQLSIARLKLESFKLVELLKTITYSSIIASPQLRLVERKAETVLKQIWDVLADAGGEHLLPDRWQELHRNFTDDEPSQKRIICDFIACMTDRACVDFHRRLFGTDGIDLAGFEYQRGL